MLHFMRDELKLKRCDVTEFEFLEDDDAGEQALLEICKEYRRDPLLRRNAVDNNVANDHDSDSDTESDEPDLEDIDFGLWVLRKDTRGRLNDDNQALREYREDKDNSEKEFVY
jgi:hypothetical protein